MILKVLKSIALCRFPFASGDEQGRELQALPALCVTLTLCLSPLLQAVFQMQSVKCLKCQEENRVVLPCQHAVLCETCAEEGECPICHPNRPHSLQS